MDSSSTSQRDIFLSIVSHELKTPITSIQGFTQAMQRKILQKLENYSDNPLFSKEELEKHNENLDTILRQIKRMNLLIDSLLDISVIERGSLSMRFATVDLYKVIIDVCERMREQTPNHKILVESSVEGINTILGDEDRLDQLFINILSNAIKFSISNANIVVAIKEDNNFYSIDIQDQGIGIAEEELDHVFDLYYRGKDIGNRKVSGLGLGLYLSKKIVESHHGSISIQSKVGHGTTIRVTFPKYIE